MDATPITFHTVVMREEHAEEICAWAYPPPIISMAFFPGSR